jgi:hypothetical protein
MEDQETGSQLPISEAYKGIKWNKLRSMVLESLYNEAPIYMQCNMSTGARFPGQWDSMPVSLVEDPLTPPPNPCSNRVDI